MPLIEYAGNLTPSQIITTTPEIINRTINETPFIPNPEVLQNAFGLTILLSFIGLCIVIYSIYFFVKAYKKIKTNGG